MRGVDLFCGAGGATRGYQMAGAYMTGVDCNDQPRYCGESFVRTDVLTLEPGWLAEFDFVHASPPCQLFSAITRTNTRHRQDHVDLIAPVRELLEATGKPYVIENVPGASLLNPVLICGSMFDPPLDVRRHRLFETNWGMPDPMWPCRHKLWAFRFRGADYRGFAEKRLSRVVPVYGNTRYAGDHELRRRAMEINWMSAKEITQALPPRYTEYIGNELAHVL